MIVQIFLVQRAHIPSIEIHSYSNIFRSQPKCPEVSMAWNTPCRLQNSPYFCVFKYTRAVKEKVWNEAENRERDLGETLKNKFFLLRACEARDFFTDFEKKPTVLQSTHHVVLRGGSHCYQSRKRLRSQARYFTNYADRVVCSGVSHIGICDHSLIHVYRKLSPAFPSKGH